MKSIRTASPSPASLWASGPTKREAGRRNGISLPGTRRATGTPTTSPEFWGQYKTDFAPGTHVRIHPLLDWTEVDIWEYIRREGVPVVSLYFNQGDGKRYRSLGCWPCTKPVDSDASTLDEIIEELKSGKFARVAERSGREQDKEDGGGLEELRRGGYM